MRSSPPRIAGAPVVVGCYDHNLYAVDAASSKFVWKYPTEDGISSTPAPAGRTGCIRRGGMVTSSPIAHGDQVYIGSADHYVYALPL